MTTKKIINLLTNTSYFIEREYFTTFQYSRLDKSYLKLFYKTQKKTTPKKLVKLERQAERLNAKQLILYIDKKLQLYYFKCNQF